MIEKHSVISPVVKVTGDIEKVGYVKLGDLQKAAKYDVIRYYETTGITVTVKEESDLNTHLTYLVKEKRWYHRNIHLLENGIAMTRDLPFGMRAILCITDLDTLHPKLTWNRLFRWWSNMRFTKVGLLGSHLESIVALKLIEQNKTLIHAGIVCGKDGGIIVAGLPNRGKTWTILSLIREGYQFLAEDIGIVSSDGTAYAVPFTTSVKDWGEQEKKASSKQKRTLFDLVGGIVVASSCNAQTLIVLERGNNNRLSEVGREEAVRVILSLNRLEFDFLRNKLLAAYCMVNGLLIDDYVERERAIVEEFVSRVEVFKIEFLCHAARDQILRSLLYAK